MAFGDDMRDGFLHREGVQLMLMKESFAEHGWEIRNEFESRGFRYYDIAKGDIKLSVQEKEGFLSVKHKAKGIQLEGELATWGNFVKFMGEFLDRMIDGEMRYQERLLGLSQKRIGKYERMKETL